MFGPGLIQSYFPLLPGVETVSLIRKTASGADPDTTSTIQNLKARRRPLSFDDAPKWNMITADGVIIWSVIDDGTNPNFIAPENEDKIRDSEGKEYTVRRVKHTCMNTLHSCACTPDWVTS